MMRSRVVGIALIAATSSALAVATSSGAANNTDADGQSVSQSFIPSDQLSLYGAEVQTLGQSEFSDTFAGAVINSNGVINVYATPQNDQMLIGSVDALNLGGTPITFLSTSRSLDQLNSINATVSAEYSTLLSEGIQLVESGPDPVSGTVQLTLAIPSASELTLISQYVASNPSLGLTAANVSQSNYGLIASEVLLSIFGDGISIASQPTSPMTANGRVGDTAPFSGGDAIWGGFYSARCSGGFSVKYSNGNRAMLTAGHCSVGTWATTSNGSPVMGTVTHQYFNNSYSDDFETIGISSALGQVWANNGNTHPINGELVPSIGGTMAFDGSVTGEVTGNVVSEVGVTEYDIDDPLNGTTYTASNLVVAYSPTNSAICAGGDSGGPAYQRESGNSDAYAIGTIVASNDGETVCAAEEIGAELSHSGTTLLTS